MNKKHIIVEADTQERLIEGLEKVLETEKARLENKLEERLEDALKSCLDCSQEESDDDQEDPFTEAENLFHIKVIRNRTGAMLPSLLTMYEFILSMRDHVEKTDHTYLGEDLYQAMVKIQEAIYWLKEIHGYSKQFVEHHENEETD